ncbi:sodium:proton antiporter [candidate division KSB1 bacterium]|nr:sodium:proton antiporter [candidate division KSB1 bacterium]
MTQHEAGGEHQAQHGGQHADLGKVLPIWSVIPFVGILLSIALFPLLAEKFWHHHFPKVSAFWALAFAIPFVIAYGGDALYEICHIYLIDYIPFIILLWALFTAAGGILIEGTLKGKPVTNLVMLLIGTIIASWIGTTGASMVLIRPVLRANANRKSKMHVVIFFIFLVSNIGGSLTPLGDPPLFLGFLHSVPFFWTLNLFTEMSFVVVLLLGIFFVLDTMLYNKDKNAGLIKEDNTETKPIRVRGLHNFIFLAGIIGGVLMSGLVDLGSVTVLGVHMGWQNILRDVILICMGLLSLKTTKKEIREGNEFSWFPIQEVAYLFAGIFMCIIPALAMLKAGTDGALGFIIEAVKEPWHYFWITGALSSFLDNAPTYLTFMNTALGNFFSGLPEADAVASLIRDHSHYLKAISTGAVFMGANTYIGNAPNFMVRSIAEESGLKMPSFFGYMVWSLGILIPIFILVTLVFF